MPPITTSAAMKRKARKQVTNPYNKKARKHTRQLAPRPAYTTQTAASRAARRMSLPKEHSDYLKMNKDIFSVDHPAYYPSKFTSQRVPVISENIWFPTVRGLTTGTAVTGVATGGFCLMLRPDLVQGYITESGDTFRSTVNGMTDAYACPDLASGMILDDNCDRMRTFMSGLQIIYTGPADERSGTVTVCFPNGNASTLPTSPSSWAQSGALSKIHSFQKDIFAQCAPFADADFQNRTSSNGHFHLNSIAIYVTGVKAGSVMIKTRSAIEFIPKVGSIVHAASTTAVNDELPSSVQKSAPNHQQGVARNYFSMSNA